MSFSKLNPHLVSPRPATHILDGTHQAEVELKRSVWMVRSMASRISNKGNNNSMGWLCEATKWEYGNTETMAEDIASKGRLAVSAGSYKDHLGTASAVLITSQARFRADVRVPGTEETQCSFRSELARLYAAIFHMNQICRQMKVHSVNMTLVCDGKAAVDSIRWYRSNPTLNWPHFNLICECRCEICKSQPHGLYNHVRAPC
jgi:hypothetical protein